LAFSFGCRDKPQAKILTIDSVQVPFDSILMTIPTPLHKYPVLLNTSKFAYPDGILHAHQTDTVWISGRVDTLGNFSPDSVLKSTSRTLDSVAIKLSHQLKFSPAEWSGKKLPVGLMCPIRFGK
jgi:hypothetical protein